MSRHSHSNRVLRAKHSETLRFLRQHKLIVLAAVHGVGVQSAPKALVYFLNLLGETLTWIFACTNLSRCSAWWDTLVALRRDCAPRLARLANRHPRWFYTWLCTSIALQNSFLACLRVERVSSGAELHDLWITWCTTLRLPGERQAVTALLRLNGSTGGLHRINVVT